MNIRYSSDSCGILIVEDSTYQVGSDSVEGEAYRDVLEDLFQVGEKE